MLSCELECLDLVVILLACGSCLLLVSLLLLDLVDDLAEEVLRVVNSSRLKGSLFVQELVTHGLLVNQLVEKLKELAAGAVLNGTKVACKDTKEEIEKVLVFALQVDCEHTKRALEVNSDLFFGAEKSSEDEVFSILDCATRSAFIVDEFRKEFFLEDECSNYDVEGVLDDDFILHDEACL